MHLCKSLIYKDVFFNIVNGLFFIQKLAKCDRIIDDLSVFVSLLLVSDKTRVSPSATIIRSAPAEVCTKSFFLKKQAHYLKISARREKKTKLALVFFRGAARSLI